MLGERKQRRWQVFAGLLALALIVLLVLPLSPGEAHAVFRDGSMPCVHTDEVPGAPVLSFGVTQLPCNGHHCAHGPFCCMSTCPVFAGLALPAETSGVAPLPDFAAYPIVPLRSPNGFGVRPALPPPRAIM